MESNYYSMVSGSKIDVAREWEGGSSATPYLSSVAHFAKQKTYNYFLLLQNMKFGGSGKRGRAKIHSPQPPFFLPARAHRIACAARSAAPRRFSEIFDKMSSSQTVKTHQNLTFRKLTDFFVGGAKRRPSISPRQILSARHGEPRLAVGQDEVRLPCDLILSRICFAQ